MGLLERESGPALAAQLQPLPLEPLDGWFPWELLPVHLGCDHHIFSWGAGVGDGREWPDRNCETLQRGLGASPSLDRRVQVPSPLLPHTQEPWTPVPSSLRLGSPDHQPPPSDLGVMSPAPSSLIPPHHSPLTLSLASSGKCQWAPQQSETGPQVELLLRRQDWGDLRQAREGAAGHLMSGA